MRRILVINVLIVLIFGILSCSGSQETKASQNIKTERTKISPLNEIFKKALEEKVPFVEKTTLYELLRNPIFKEEVIKRYSTKFHTMAEEITERSAPVEYNSIDNYYYCEGLSENGTVDVKYYVDTDKLDILMQYHRQEVRHDGTIDCGNWVKGYWKNPFGEYDLNDPYIEHEFHGKVNDTFDCQLHVRFEANGHFRLWVEGEYCCNYSPREVEMLIRDEDDGEVYSISTKIHRDYFFVDARLENLFSRLLDKGNLNVSIRYLSYLDDYYYYRFRIYSETKFEAARTLLN
ncbi:hypothetical protein K330107F9_04530 [Bacteroides stercoris]|uniref:hypothetical protein n=1 Tax=Bacteroides stercoris TaxID=46506 RepID=UPI0036F333FA